MKVPHDTAVVVLSGGQDSTTCLYRAKAEHASVHAITFDYGQRHAREIACALAIGEHVGLDSHKVVRCGDGILESTSPLVSSNELEQYADHKSLPGGIEKTFVPLRNQLFLTIAANYAVAKGARYLYTGVCEEDFGGYPDCREVFIRALEKTINLSNEGAAPAIEIITPLMHLTKAATVRMATDMPGCYAALALTHTSYDGNYPPTGHDHATLLRAKGFEEAGVPDPLVLRAWIEQKMELPESPNYHNKQFGHYFAQVQNLFAAKPIFHKL